jgi:hypothetical protein
MFFLMFPHVPQVPSFQCVPSKVFKHLTCCPILFGHGILTYVISCKGGSKECMVQSMLLFSGGGEGSVFKILCWKIPHLP